MIGRAFRCFCERVVIAVVLLLLPACGGQGSSPDQPSVPVVSSTSPAPGAVLVPLNSAVTVTFSEHMDPRTLTSSTFLLQQGGNAVPGTVTPGVATATFTPAAPLAANTTYTATITTGAKNIAGNALSAQHTWSFTTGSTADNIPPTVVSNTPLNGAVSVSKTAPGISATFSKAMDPATINQLTFTLTFGGTPGVPVQGTVVSSGTTASFTPLAPLEANTTYTATITTGARDLAGNALAGPFSWSFTTSLL